MSDAHARLAPETRRTIFLLSLGTFASMASQRICDAMLPELARVFNSSLAQVAQVVSVFAITYGAAQLFYGPLGDRFGKFRVITFCTMACSIGCVVAASAVGLDMLILARFLMALCAAALIPLTLAWMGDTIPSDQLQEMLTRTGLGTTLGIVGGQLVGGILTDTLGWRWAFVFLALLFGVVGSLLFVDWRRQAARQQEGAPSHGTANGQGFIRRAIAIATGPWSRQILILAVIEGASSFGVLAIWASHLHNTLGLSIAASGAIVALFGMGGVLYMMVGRPIIRRLGQWRLVVVGGSLLGVCALVVAYAPHWLATVPASLLAGFGFFMFHNTMQTSATQMAPGARGTGVSLFASCLFLGQSLGVVLAAGLIDRLGTANVVALGGVVMALASAYFAWALKRHHRLA
ncbi:MAG: MFS transporter [Pseudomonadota bacterium]